MNRPTNAYESKEFRLAEQVEGVSRLDLSESNLKDLKRLAPFRNLSELILDQNHLCDRHLESFPTFQSLKTLSLNKNEIENLDRLLDILQTSCPSLTYLSLLGNPVCPLKITEYEEAEDDYRCYRLYVLYKLPNLRALDSTMFSKTDRSEAATKGSFLKTVRPSPAATLATDSDDDFNFNNYNPLPMTSESSPRQASFGKKQHFYSGKYSEGNRFIRNRDL